MRPRPSSNSPYVGISKDLLDWFEELLANPVVQRILDIPTKGPIFVLDARDKFTPETVEFWLTQAANSVDRQKWFGAKEHHEEIVEWQRNNPTKVKIPD